MHCGSVSSILELYYPVHLLGPVLLSGTPESEENYSRKLFLEFFCWRKVSVTPKSFFFAKFMLFIKKVLFSNLRSICQESSVCACCISYLSRELKIEKVFTDSIPKTLFLRLFQNNFLLLTSILGWISTCFCGKAIINQLHKTLQVFLSRFSYLIFTSFVIDCWKRFGEWKKECWPWKIMEKRWFSYSKFYCFLQFLLSFIIKNYL